MIIEYADLKGTNTTKRQIDQIYRDFNDVSNEFVFVLVKNKLEITRIKMQRLISVSDSDWKYQLNKCSMEFGK